MSHIPVCLMSYVYNSIQWNLCRMVLWPRLENVTFQQCALSDPLYILTHCLERMSICSETPAVRLSVSYTIHWHHPSSPPTYIQHHQQQLHQLNNTYPQAAELQPTQTTTLSTVTLLCSPTIESCTKLIHLLALRLSAVCVSHAWPS